MLHASLRISRGAWDKLCAHLLQSDGLEHLAFLPVGLHHRAERLELLASEVFPIADADLVSGAAPFRLEAKPEALLSIVNRAIRQEVGLIEVHNHPGTYGRCEFSPSDRSGFRDTVPYMLSSLKVPIYGAIVLGGQDNADGVIWPRSPDSSIPIHRVDVVGTDGEVLRTSSSPSEPAPPTAPLADPLARFDRQVRAFGRAGQSRLSALSVGVVGLGGIGSVAVQQLARIGVGRFVLVDHDRVEFTNLNRLDGAMPSDAAALRFKVDIAARRIRRANPDASVCVLRAKVFDLEAIENLSGVDLLVGCTDDSASRYTLNDIALAYLRPYLDLATGIDTTEGKLAGVGGRYTFTFPGGGCLLCARAIDPADAAFEFELEEVADAQVREGYIRGSNEPAPAVMPLNALVASLAVTEVLAWSTGFRPVIRQRFCDELRGTVEKVTFVRARECLACNDLLGRGDLAGLASKYSRWSNPLSRKDRPKRDWWRLVARAPRSFITGLGMGGRAVRRAMSRRSGPGSISAAASSVAPGRRVAAGG